MEISKLTICRHDVIVVSDTETELNGVHSNKRKKLKRKTKYVRDVKLTTTTVNRVVPYCYRQRCRNDQHYHRQTSTNTKYRKREAEPAVKRYKKSEPPAMNILCKTGKHEDDIKMVLTRDLCSPVTVASSNDMYENISTSSFNITSSDSDELEDLINITRQRMKNDNGNFYNYPLRKSICANTIEDDYQDISSNDDILDSSIHSMDTVVLYHGDTISSHSESPNHLDHIEQNNNNNIEPMLSYTDSNLDSSKVLQHKIPSLSNQEKKDNLSPLYEISGKVFMEHYLNTNFV